MRYIARANTKSQAIEKALSLLRQFIPAGELLNIETNEKSVDDTLLYMTVTIKGREDSPVVYLNKNEVGSESRYFLYLLENEEKLSFCVRCLFDFRIMLPSFRPLQKPTEPLTVEAMRTPRGYRQLEEYFNYGEPVDEHKEDVELFQETDKEKRIYSLFEDYGVLSLSDIEEEMEEGLYEGGTIDGEMILSEITGDTYETEEKYLEAVASFCGVEAVEKFKSQLVEGYRFYTVDRYLRYLEYRLRQTEDYAQLKEEEPELARRYGFKREYLDSLADIGEASTVDVALAHVIDNYTSASHLYDGLSSQRIANYMKVPEKSMRLVLANDKLKKTLL